eukprot:c20130_g1_i2 orf=65-1513(+)
MDSSNQKTLTDSDYEESVVRSRQGHALGNSLGVEQIKGSQVDIPEKQGLRKLFAYVGPGFLVAIAYIDPGNFESDLKAGAQFKYELLWVLLIATIVGILIQSLSSNLGVVTGKHLAEHCRVEYPPKANYLLWLLAEVAIVASDVPEVIGTAYALNLLFGIQLWVGVLLTGFSTLIFLALQQYGVRKLEFLIFLLVFTIAICYFIELGYARPSLREVFHGLVVPNLQGHGAFGIAISLMGAMVMPHNLYLHSALVLTRKTPRTIRGIKHVLGRWSSTLFAIALLASGQSSTITGTYAGQYVMQGFLELRFSPWVRNMLTRCVAIVPSLVVALIGGARGAGELIIVSSMILSFELPFALLPLLKFTSNNVKMGPCVNSSKVSVLTWIIGSCIILGNMLYLSSGFIKWITKTTLPLPAIVMLGILGVSALLSYISFACYLALRTDRTETYILPQMAESIDIVEDEVDNAVEMNECEPFVNKSGHD